MRALFTVLVIGIIGTGVFAQIPGGESEQDPKKPEWLPLADLALHTHLASASDNRPHSVIKIVKVKTQVVAGRLVTVEFIAAPADEPARTLQCTASIWERPWLKSTEVTKVTCQP